jgi:hypothetical protein
MPSNFEFHLPSFPTSSSPQTASRDISSSLITSTALTYAMGPSSSEASPSASLSDPSIAELDRKRLIQRATGATIRGQALGLPIPALSSSSKQHHQYPAGHIPRPPNSFFCFRRRFAAEVMAIDKRPRTGMSGLAGEAWRALSKEEKAPWRAEALRIKKEHLLANPGYKYQPQTGMKGKRKERTTSCIERSIAASPPLPRGEIAAQTPYVHFDTVPADPVELSPLGSLSALPAIGTVGAPTSVHGTESFSEEETHSYALTSSHSPVVERAISSGWETSSFEFSFPASLSPSGAGFSQLGFIPFSSTATPLVLPSPPTSPPPPPMLHSALLWTPDVHTPGPSLGLHPYATHPSVLPEGVSQVPNVGLGSWALPMHLNGLIFPQCPPASSFSDAHSGDFLALEQLFPADTFYAGVVQPLSPSSPLCLLISLETPPDSTYIVPRALQSEDQWSETVYDHTASTSSWSAALP